MSPNVLEPRYRAILAVDIERSTARTDTAKALLREVTYDVLEDALHTGGIPAEYRDPMIDRGDGALVLVRPVDQAPKTLLLNPVIPLLTSLLADHNTRHPDLELRLRAVVHAGEIHRDQRGWFGESLDVAFRLLDAPEIKTTLRTVSAPLVLVASEYIYRSIVRHGYDGIDARGFAPLRVRTAGEEHRGWAQASQNTVRIAKQAS